MANWYYDSTGIYRCVRCDAPFSPGHNAREHPTIANQSPIRLRKMNGEKLETGMAMIHANEQIDPPDLGRLL